MIIDDNNDDIQLKTFGLAVKRLRLKASISQEELGFRAGLDRTYISGIELGRRNPTVKIVFKICLALNINASELFDVAHAIQEEIA